MNENVQKTEFNARKTLCYLSKNLEESNSSILNLIQPDFIEGGRRKKNKRFPSFGNEPNGEENLTNEEKSQVVLKINELGEYLKTEAMDSVLFVALFTLTVNGNRSIDLDDIARFFDISSIDAFVFKSKLNTLAEKNLIRKEYSHRSSESVYYVDEKVINAISDNLPLDTIKHKVVDKYAFTKQVSDWIEERSRESIDTDELIERVKRYENENRDMEFVQTILKLPLHLEERLFFYEMCDDFLSVRGQLTEVDCTLTDIYDSPRCMIPIARAIMENEHPLQKEDLMELQSAGMYSDAEVVLTDRGKQIFLGSDVDLFTKSDVRTAKNMLIPDDIKHKKLFFTTKTAGELDFLKKNLIPEQFHKLQDRLSDKGLPKGVAVLFYGEPGTGKTESALQIAKATGRKIVHVDISASKSCWFGESEKIIKRIFTNYKDLCKHEKETPILLFNEADALFSKRKDVNSSNVAQTENAIQNIILEEIEKLDGILIATTNLIQNLDSAFDRRFLFKVRFDKPTVEAKKAIWQNKLEWLTDEECTKLAQSFNLSGGEIDNIVRKVVMEEVLNGERPNCEFIEGLCRNEKMDDSKGKSIGFK